MFTENGATSVGFDGAAPNGQHDTAARPGHSPHGGPSAMGTDVPAQGAISMISLEAEMLPPNTRTVQEPAGEWLK